MWKNTLEPSRPQMIMLHMHTAWWMLKATKTHSDYVTVIAILLQQWLHEHSSVLCYMYIASLDSSCNVCFIFKFPFWTFSFICHPITGITWLEATFKTENVQNGLKTNVKYSNLWHLTLPTFSFGEYKNIHWPCLTLCMIKRQPPFIPFFRWWIKKCLRYIWVSMIFICNVFDSVVINYAYLPCANILW